MTAWPRRASAPMKARDAHQSVGASAQGAQAHQCKRTNQSAQAHGLTDETRSMRTDRGCALTQAGKHTDEGVPSPCMGAWNNCTDPGAQAHHRRAKSRHANLLEKRREGQNPFSGHCAPLTGVAYARHWPKLSTHGIASMSSALLLYLRRNRVGASPRELRDPVAHSRSKCSCWPMSLRWRLAA